MLTGTDGAPYAAELIHREEAERIVGEQDPETLARIAWAEAFSGYFDGEAVLDLKTGEVGPSARASHDPHVPGFDHLLMLHECPADLKERLGEEWEGSAEDPIPASLAAGAVGPEAIRRRLDDIYDPPGND